MSFPLPVDNALAHVGPYFSGVLLLFSEVSGPGKLLRYRDIGCVPAWGEFLSDYSCLQPLSYLSGLGTRITMHFPQQVCSAGLHVPVLFGISVSLLASHS